MYSVNSFVSLSTCKLCVHYYLCCVGQDTLTICHGYVRVHVEPDVPDRLLSLRGDYVDMLIKLGETKLKKKVFKRFKLFLSHVCDENSIQDCSAVSTVVELLVEKLIISLFNIDILCICCRRFVLINGPVQSYKCQLKEFLSSTIVKNFKCSLKTELSRLNNVERVTLKLDESRTKNTLKNLKELLFHFFSNASKALVLCETRPGCVCVTWLVPISLVPTLRSMAEQLSHDYLASQGVLELVIGLRIVPNEGLYCMDNNTIIHVLMYVYVHIYTFQPHACDQKWNFSALLVTNQCQSLMVCCHAGLVIFMLPKIPYM